MKKILLALYILITVLTSSWGKDTFTALFAGSTIDFNPHTTFTSTEAQVYTAVFEGLVTYHPKTLAPLPAAAESWKISDDGLTYTFTLRKNLRYSNGDPILAAHFRDSWLKLMAPETGSDYGSLLNIVKNGEAFREGKCAASDVGIKAPDDRTLIINLEQKAPHLLKVLCHHAFSPLHPDFYKHPGKDMIVNGPYKIETMEDGEIHFVKNEYYWDKDNVSIENLAIKFSDNAKENTLAFNRDEADWLTDSYDLSVLTLDETVILNPLFSTSYLYFSNRQDIWKNGNLRRALALLFPWKDIRSTQLIPDSSLIPSIPGYPASEGITAENKEEAMNLLKEEGYENGKGLPPVKLLFPRSKAMEEIGEEIKKSLSDNLNLDVQVVTEDFPDYYQSLKNDDYTIGALTWIGDYADPMTFLEMWLHSSSLNEASYNNKDYDDKISKSAGADLEERYKLMSEAEGLLLQSAQVMPLGHSPAVNIIDLRFVDGWYPNVLDIHPFKYLKFKTFRIPGSV